MWQRGGDYPAALHMELHLSQHVFSVRPLQQILLQIHIHTQDDLFSVIYTYCALTKNTSLILGSSSLCSIRTRSSYHWFHMILETFLWDSVPCWHDASHLFCRFVICTFMLPVSRSTTSQRLSTGSRSGDLEGYWSPLNSLSCLWNQFETFALWPGSLGCWKLVIEDGELWL